jgi:hypothetical protein
VKEQTAADRAQAQAGDPYGTEPICDASLSPRTSAKGILVDRETRRPITANDACAAPGSPHEAPWDLRSTARPPFRQFHSADDGIVDHSCMEKAGAQLRAHGFGDAGAFVIPSSGRRGVLFHLWRMQYNEPLLEFFAAQTAP